MVTLYTPIFVLKMKFLFFITIVILSFNLFGFNKQKIKTQSFERLGELLFFDKDLSINKSKSCANCHNPSLFFTDGYRRAIGTYGDVMARNTPSIINSASLKSFNWADPNIFTYQQQMITPLFSFIHFEMGMQKGNEEDAKKILNKKMYQPFIKNNKKIWATIINAIASYQQLLISSNSKYDLFIQGKIKFDKEELLGKELFFSNSLNCSQCHGGNNFNEPANNIPRFINTGIYEDNKILYGDSGLANITKKQEDIGKFRIPSLRNVAATAPYYHDGSGATLKEVIENYAQGGSVNNTKNKNKHELIKGFKISENEKKCLIKFLNTLTDSSIIKKFKAPF